MQLTFKQRPLKTIRYFQIQSIVEATLELPATGVIMFYGENSHGKSILTKMLSWLIRGKFLDPKKRRAAINENCHFGELELTKWGGGALLLHVDLEAAATYLQITYPNGTVVKRFLSEKGWDTIVADFGFHYSDERDLSMNIYETYDPLLFAMTSGVVNYSMLSSAAEDRDAAQAIKILAALIENAQKTVKDCEQDMVTCQAQLGMLRFCDQPEEEKKLQKLRGYKVIISYLATEDPPVIEAVPDLTIVNALDTEGMVEELAPPEVFDDKVTAVVLHLCGEDYDLPAGISQEVEEYEEAYTALRDGVCPVCGTSLEEGFENE